MPSAMRTWLVKLVIPVTILCIVKLEISASQSMPGLLYPRESESREVRSLDGLWNFAVVPPEDSLKGQREKWFVHELSKSAEVMQMPVPSSYNDITTSKKLRNHVGVVWYERSFFVPRFWSKNRVFVRFGSVNYFTEVWLNGNQIMKHEMGHLPFEAEISSLLKVGGKNRITVAVDNSLFQTSIPQGQVTERQADDNGTAVIQSYTFDFFNYAGIHRPVLLYTTPRVYIEDITVTTDVFLNNGSINYIVEAAGLSNDEVAQCTVTLREEDGTLATKEPVKGFSGTIKVPNAELWWARGMAPSPGYLYTLEVSVFLTNTTESDIYRLPIGIRTIKWTNTSLLLNDKPVYMRGFGRHEDSVIRGRGLDLVTMTRDYELLKWIGANAYRTTHYPYSEEVMDMADRQGFLIIDECPSVDTEYFSDELLSKHKQSISELIRRDKNRPSVIMWSIANEPKLKSNASDPYFKNVAYHTKSLDPTRPITMAISVARSLQTAGQYLDIISFNRYNAWYSNPGRDDMIVENVIREAEDWNGKYNKPVLMSEYGADTMPGMHDLPEYIWSEEYQIAVLSNHFKAFDILRKKGWFIGEFIWNFADFRTAEGYIRVGGNKKGIFTRTREPKMAAYHVRKRYHALAAEIDGENPPEDLEYYIAPNPVRL